MPRFDHYRKKINLKKILVDIILVYILSVIVVMLFNSMFMQAFKIHSISMEPQIKDDTWIIINKYIYGPKYPFTEQRIFDATKNIRRGDVIVFMSNDYMKTNSFYKSVSMMLYTLSFTLIELPNGLDGDDENIYIKRVIGVPGDTIKFKNIDGKTEVFINDILEKNAIDRKYDIIDDNEKYPLISETRVGKDEYYVLGDNRKNSSDSRVWGSIKSNQIIGKAIYEYHPKFGVIK